MAKHRLTILLLVLSTSSSHASVPFDLKDDRDVGVSEDLSEVRKTISNSRLSYAMTALS